MPKNKNKSTKQSPKKIGQSISKPTLVSLQTALLNRDVLDANMLYQLLADYNKGASREQLARAKEILDGLNGLLACKENVGSYEKIETELKLDPHNMVEKALCKLGNGMFQETIEVLSSSIEILLEGQYEFGHHLIASTYYYLSIAQFYIGNGEEGKRNFENAMCFDEDGVAIPSQDLKKLLYDLDKNYSAGIFEEYLVTLRKIDPVKWDLYAAKQAKPYSIVPPYHLFQLLRKEDKSNDTRSFLSFSELNYLLWMSNCEFIADRNLITPSIKQILISQKTKFLTQVTKDTIGSVRANQLKSVFKLTQPYTEIGLLQRLLSVILFIDVKQSHIEQISHHAQNNIQELEQRISPQQVTPPPIFVDKEAALVFLSAASNVREQLLAMNMILVNGFYTNATDEVITALQGIFNFDMARENIETSKRESIFTYIHLSFEKFMGLESEAFQQINSDIANDPKQADLYLKRVEIMEKLGRADYELSIHLHLKLYIWLTMHGLTTSKDSLGQQKVSIIKTLEKLRAFYLSTDLKYTDRLTLQIILADHNNKDMKTSEYIYMLIGVADIEPEPANRKRYLEHALKFCGASTSFSYITHADSLLKKLNILPAVTISYEVTTSQGTTEPLAASPLVVSTSGATVAVSPKTATPRSITPLAVSPLIVSTSAAMVEEKTKLPKPTMHHGTTEPLVVSPLIESTFAAMVEEKTKSPKPTMPHGTTEPLAVSSLVESTFAAMVEEKTKSPKPTMPHGTTESLAVSLLIESTSAAMVEEKTKSPKPTMSHGTTEPLAVSPLVESTSTTIVEGKAILPKPTIPRSSPKVAKLNEEVKEPLTILTSAATVQEKTMSPRITPPRSTTEVEELNEEAKKPLVATDSTLQINKKKKARKTKLHKAKAVNSQHSKKSNFISYKKILAEVEANETSMTEQVAIPVVQSAPVSFRLSNDIGVPSENVKHRGEKKAFKIVTALERVHAVGCSQSNISTTSMGTPAKIVSAEVAKPAIESRQHSLSKSTITKKYSETQSSASSSAHYDLTSLQDFPSLAAVKHPPQSEVEKLKQQLIEKDQQLVERNNQISNLTREANYLKQTLKEANRAKLMGEGTLQQASKKIDTLQQKLTVKSAQLDDQFRELTHYSQEFLLQSQTIEEMTQHNLMIHSILLQRTMYDLMYNASFIAPIDISGLASTNSAMSVGNGLNSPQSVAMTDAAGITQTRQNFFQPAGVVTSNDENDCVARPQILSPGSEF